MDRYAEHLAKITEHEAEAAQASGQFERHIEEIRKLAGHVALNEVEHELHAQDPKLSQLTGTSLADINELTRSNRNLLEIKLEEAIKAKKQAIFADLSALQERTALLGGGHQD